MRLHYYSKLSSIVIYKSFSFILIIMNITLFFLYFLFLPNWGATVFIYMMLSPLYIRHRSRIYRAIKRQHDSIQVHIYRERGWSFLYERPFPLLYSDRLRSLCPARAVAWNGGSHHRKSISRKKTKHVLLISKGFSILLNAFLFGHEDLILNPAGKLVGKFLTNGGRWTRQQILVSQKWRAEARLYKFQSFRLGRA